MKRIYKVGGHKFAIVMPGQHMFWEVMQNYESFRVEDDDQCLFSAELTDELPDTSDKRKVTTNCEGPDQPRFDLYEWKDLWLFEGASGFEASIRYRCITDKAFTKAKFTVFNDPKFSINSVLMLMYTFATQCKDTLMMHSSVTVKDGKGYLFLGKSGTGKSTHSQLWINNIEGCELLNDDNPVLRMEENGEVRVYGTPWSGKTPCYRNLDYPVGAIVNLHQAGENKISKLSIVRAYATIFVSASSVWFAKDMADGLHATIEKIACKVPIYSMDCLPNADAAFLCHDTVTQ